MSNKEVVIVPTGVANLASVKMGLGRAGAEPRLAHDAEDVARAPAVVLPGVGAFAAGMHALRRHGYAEALQTRIDAGRPTLAICLGLQLLCEGSEESEADASDTAPGGLGLVPGWTERFPDSVRSPQFGWNHIEADGGCRHLRSGFAYFANSYRLTEPPPGASVAMAENGGAFVAAFERGALLACQFHPELSGAYGLDLLKAWLGEVGC